MDTSSNPTQPGAESPVRILLIEDSPLDAELFREFLADANVMPFQLVHTDRLEKGLKQLATVGFDVIFLDFKLPDSDGFESLDKLAKRVPNMPVIMLTGLDDDDVGLKAVEHGAQDYLVKGEVDERTIWRVLRHAIARKHIEEQLREQRELERRVQQAQRAESLMVLAGGIAHEYNNLLTGIMGNVALALAELSSVSPTRALLHEIQLAANRASQLTNQMLTYSGKGSYREHEIDLVPLIRDMRPLLEAAVSPHAKLTDNLPDESLPVVGDAAQLQQILISLVSNASDAIGNEPGKVTIEAGERTVRKSNELEQSVMPLRVRPGPFAVLSVSDTGCGMTEDTLNRIFDPFFTTKFVGRGLGLASVLGIVRGHHGAVRVKSEPYKGTVFEVFLPLHRKRQRGTSEVPVSPESSQPWRGTGTVLIIDEEELILSIDRKILEACNLNVLAASNGEQGLQRIGSLDGELDLLILDVAMSRGGDEVRVLEALNAACPGVPVLVTSGMTMEDATERLRQYRPTEFLQKPYVPDALVQKVRSILEDAGA
jgi:signal transduction histidine kinase